MLYLWKLCLKSISSPFGTQVLSTWLSKVSFSWSRSRCLLSMKSKSSWQEFGCSGQLSRLIAVQHLVTSQLGLSLNPCLNLRYLARPGWGWGTDWGCPKNLSKGSSRSIVVLVVIVNSIWAKLYDHQNLPLNVKLEMTILEWRLIWCSGNNCLKSSQTSLKAS